MADSTFMTDMMEKQGKRLWRNTLRVVALPLGALLFVIGLVLFPLPIPLGLVMMMLGLFLAATNPRVLRWLRNLRSQFPEVSQRLKEATPHMPGFLQRFLKRTEKPTRTPKS